MVTFLNKGPHFVLYFVLSKRQAYGEHNDMHGTDWNHCISLMRQPPGCADELLIIGNSIWRANQQVAHLHAVCFLFISCACVYICWRQAEPSHLQKHHFSGKQKSNIFVEPHQRELAIFHTLYWSLICENNRPSLGLINSIKIGHTGFHTTVTICNMFTFFYLFIYL